MKHFQDNEKAEFDYDWLMRQKYEFKLLALLAVLADNNLAYRGTLSDMCAFFGVASGNSRTDRKIKDAIIHSNQVLIITTNFSSAFVRNLLITS